MRDRWASRPECTPGRGMLYWHVLMSPYAQACAAATDAQKIIARFSGFHMTPLRWLHMTTLIAGSTDDITRPQMAAMISEARRRLSEVAPIPATLGRIFYHPEAIVLGVEPAESLRVIHDAAESATLQVLGKSWTNNEPLSTWTPHVTVSYSTAEQPAGPIISALGRSVRQRQISIDSLTLVIQWGPDRLWDWEPVGGARLGSPLGPG
jgi:2'-5' RNA ligase